MLTRAELCSWVEFWALDMDVTEGSEVVAVNDGQTLWLANLQDYQCATHIVMGETIQEIQKGKYDSYSVVDQCKFQNTIYRRVVDKIKILVLEGPGESKVIAEREILNLVTSAADDCIVPLDVLFRATYKIGERAGLLASVQSCETAIQKREMS